ncbi:MAG: hypothetical protein LBJ47_03420, partial [Tannerella sp.]|nr:hypothetical protein [Tannerella sp.]
MKKTVLIAGIIVLTGSLASCGGGKKSEKAAEEQTVAVEEEATVDPKLVAEGPYEKLIPATDESPAYVLID